MEERKPAARVERSTRSTGMGAFNDCYIYSMRQEKELSPQRGNSSRTGNHGTKTWFLLPGRYFQLSAAFSNSGKGGWRFGVLTINQDLTESFEQQGINQVPPWLKQIAPSSALKALEPEPHW